MYVAQVQGSHAGLEIGKKIQSHLPSGDDVWVKSSWNSATAKDVLVERATMRVAVSSPGMPHRISSGHLAAPVISRTIG